MNSKKFSEAMGELDNIYVDEAINYKKKAQKPGWIKWGLVAACFAVVAILGVGIFPNLPVSAHAVFRTSEMDAGNLPELIGFEGNIGNIKMVVSTSDISLLNTVIAGTEETTEINGINIIAGYCVTDPNSKGEQTAIHYATLKIGNCKV